MFESIWNDVKREFNHGNMVTRIIIINVAIFVAVNIFKLVLFVSNGGQLPGIYDTVVHFFCMSSDWKFLLTHPWGIITSMFLHEGFWHILWNMLFMYWFGRIVGDFIGNQRILPIYLLGGIAGAILFFVSANLLPNMGIGRYALGASAGVMAIVVAAGAISPDYVMRLLFLGDVKLKYIVAVLVFLDLIVIPDGANTGGHIAHLGGAFFGWFFVFQLRNGTDLSLPVNNLISTISNFFSSLFSGSRRSKPKVAYRNPNRPKNQTRGERRTRKSEGQAASDNTDQHQERLDRILDKIKQSGYESLSAEEKEFLFNASKK
jgi:membrane associated rhomboid family serine protease